MYVYMWVYVHVYMHMCVLMYVHIRGSMYVSVSVHICVLMCMCVSACVCMYMWVCVCAYVCACVCVSECECMSHAHDYPQSQNWLSDPSKRSKRPCLKKPKARGARKINNPLKKRINHFKSYRAIKEDTWHQGPASISMCTYSHIHVFKHTSKIIFKKMFWKGVLERIVWRGLVTFPDLSIAHCTHENNTLGPTHLYN